MISQQDLIALIDLRLNEKGLSARAASMRAVNNPELIRSIRSGHSPSMKNVQKLLDVLNIHLSVDSEADTTRSQVPLLGLIGAGSRVAYFNDHIGLDSVSIPENNDKNLAAAEVRGNSMEPVYHQGDVIFFDPEDPTRFDIARHVGQDCIVTLEEDSSALLKTVECGSIAGTWNLHSHNSEMEMIKNQALLSALPIRWVKRRTSKT